jgi:glycosyltransferase involved in cell wall biosynthesis
MYEYLAMGLPVVASRFSAEVQKYPGQVLAPQTTAEFVLACEEFVAVAGDHSLLSGFREEAYNVASQHDWRVVAESFWRRVKSLYVE